MATEITRVDVWAAEIEDRAGALAQKLDAVAKSGANLEFVIARRCPDKPGSGVVFLAPLAGEAQTRAAEQAGLARTASMHSIRLEGADQAGFGAKMTRLIADAGINMRGLSAAAVGQRCVVYFAFDTNADAEKATGILKRAFAGG
ncbi:MAG: hypothetical protein JSV19_12435 [Phycisphaerales bacterium]|nr:MAG: hypothetical protein JSV19_12435 [Phycisphaerales bacterium]